VNILLTGGAGYIGSHVAIAVLEYGHRPVIFDNFVNSTSNVIALIELIVNKTIDYIEGDIHDMHALIKVIQENKIDAVIHLAGLKSVSESNEKPLDYFSVNVGGTISLLQAMMKTGVRHLVFSSSATVYGEPSYLPIDESHPTNPTNVYGKTKLQTELILRDLSESDASWKIGCLRYFNPVGAHHSGLIGEAPLGRPNNLMPIIASVAVGERGELKIFGGDYGTKDGTGIRDYVHVMDLARGHLASINYLAKVGSHLVNLGTGMGYSVLDVVGAYQQVSCKTIPYSVQKRRPGDVAAVYANTKLAESILGWRATQNLYEMCATSWAWKNQQHKI
jgi:UDP-glucose 4-epimerase